MSRARAPLRAALRALITCHRSRKYSAQSTCMQSAKANKAKTTSSDPARTLERPPLLRPQPRTCPRTDDAVLVSGLGVYVNMCGLELPYQDIKLPVKAEAKRFSRGCD
ncbi:unnamed protein product [Leuciscus chuanchicus]